jgi:hypothetical protein
VGAAIAALGVGEVTALAKSAVAAMEAWKPATVTIASLASVEGPTPLSPSGSITRLGTKNTGRNLSTTRTQDDNRWRISHRDETGGNVGRTG